MKKHKNLLILVPVYLVLIYLVGCSKNEEEESVIIFEKNSTVRILNSNDIPEIMDFIKSKNNESLIFELESYPLDNMRNHENDLILTSVQEDQINQVMNSFGKSSYTFKMTEEQDKQGVYFINLNVKEHLDDYYMFFTKYVPDDNWLNHYNEESDFANFSGDLFFYDETGSFIARAEMINGQSSSISKTNCDSDSNSGGGTDDSTPGDNGSNSEGGEGDGGGSLLDNLEVSWGWLCNWRGQLHDSPSACNNPGMGGTWTMLIDYGNGDKSMSHFLRTNCDDEEVQDCYNEVGDPCPNGCDENGNCYEDDEVENSGSGINYSLEDVLALMNELNGIVGENTIIQINHDLPIESTISFNSIEEFEEFYTGIAQSDNAIFEIFNESQSIIVNKFTHNVDPLLGGAIVFLVEVELADPDLNECLTVNDVNSYLTGNTMMIIEWEPDESYNVTLEEETNKTRIDLYGRVEYGISIEGITLSVSSIYLNQMRINNTTGTAAGFVTIRVD